jgi:hypothetical protein
MGVRRRDKGLPGCLTGGPSAGRIAQVTNCKDAVETDKRIIALESRRSQFRPQVGGSHIRRGDKQLGQPTEPLLVWRSKDLIEPIRRHGHEGRGSHPAPLPAVVKQVRPSDQTITLGGSEPWQRSLPQPRDTRVGSYAGEDLDGVFCSI